MTMMLINCTGFLLILFLVSFATADSRSEFIYNGFKESKNLHGDGTADITTDGLLRLITYVQKKRLTYDDAFEEVGHVFYSHAIQFKNPPSVGNTTTNTTANNVYSFSTTFVFGIIPYKHGSRGHGFAFCIAPARGLPGAQSSQFLGLFNDKTNDDSANHVFAVELDTNMNSEYGDIDKNHVGIDINSIRSTISKTAGYFTNSTRGGFKNLNLVNQKLQVWIEYDGGKKQLDVTLAPFMVPKPNISLLSLPIDLSPILQDYMYVGFSSGNGNYHTSNYILGWSFKLNGQAQELNLLKLPDLPRPTQNTTKILIILITLFVLITIFIAVFLIVRRARNFPDEEWDWEPNYRSHRFSYKDLYIATKGFSEKELIGIGGFGKVYKGILSTSKIEVAVKRVSHGREQGMKEFIAEIVSIGQLQHRNLVQLLGYCRRKGELLLVYDLMPNGSLDKFLFAPLDDLPSLKVLDWNQRLGIIKGVASGLLYLHQDFVQVVIHGDIKAGNVLLDSEMNARLSDFGLARLHIRGTDSQTTRVAGTFGYLAPEMLRTRKFTTSTDVYAFGAFLLEVCCGRRPIEQPQEDLILFEWVLSCWRKGSILETSDPKLGNDYVKEEMELVLKLGLLCSHNVPASRPSMKQVMQYLEGEALLPVSELWEMDVNVGLSTNLNIIFEESSMSSYPM